MPSGYLLDANLFRLYVNGDPVTVAAVLTCSEMVWLSSVTVEEMIVGRLNIINRARSGKSPISLVRAHEELIELIGDIRPFLLLTYSEAAERVYQTFPPSVRRIGPQDCRIAAQALAHDMIVVTRNLRDFEAIGAPCTDWSAAA